MVIPGLSKIIAKSLRPVLRESAQKLLPVGKKNALSAFQKALERKTPFRPSRGLSLQEMDQLKNSNMYPDTKRGIIRPIWSPETTKPSPMSDAQFKDQLLGKMSQRNKYLTQQSFPGGKGNIRDFLPTLDEVRQSERLNSVLNNNEKIQAPMPPFGSGKIPNINGLRLPIRGGRSSISDMLATIYRGTDRNIGKESFLTPHAYKLQGYHGDIRSGKKHVITDMDNSEVQSMNQDEIDLLNMMRDQGFGQSKISLSPFIHGTDKKLIIDRSHPGAANVSLEDRLKTITTPGIFERTTPKNKRTVSRIPNPVREGDKKEILPVSYAEDQTPLYANGNHVSSIEQLLRKKNMLDQIASPKLDNSIKLYDRNGKKKTDKEIARLMAELTPDSYGSNMVDNFVRSWHPKNIRKERYSKSNKR